MVSRDFTIPWLLGEVKYVLTKSKIKMIVWHKLSGKIMVIDYLISYITINDVFRTEEGLTRGAQIWFMGV